MVFMTNTHTYMPNQSDWLYNDRGIIKWFGFFMSDHTEKMNQDEQQYSPIDQQPIQQDSMTVNMLLHFAISTTNVATITITSINTDKQHLTYQGEIDEIDLTSVTIINNFVPNKIPLDQIMNVSVENW